MKETVEDSGRGGIVLEQLAPIFDGAIGRYEGAFSGSIAIKDDIEEIVGCLFRDFLTQEQIIDNQQVGFRQDFGEFFPPLELSGLEEVLKKGVGFPVDDFITVEDGGVSDGFGDVAFARSGGSNQ